MPARRIRVELFDSEGNRYTIAFEGQITRDKAVRLLDIVELLGGVPNENINAEQKQTIVDLKMSKCEKVRMVVQRNFQLIWFSSKDLQSAYEQELREPIGLSTAATYLSRMALKGMLVKAGAANSLKYRLAQKAPQIHLKQQMPVQKDLSEN
jgi:hypothetical protein